ncbi:trimeric autotransporter adhesin Ata [Acinetobacter seifertii]|uniref:trimeric autotransporter adhesin Ata n=2 Tax=Acinetobacter TaxID=469 RepID=UPI000D39B7E3|nr:trimeric autotransporter adhesin Ata [Acinetobacter seifertii]PTV52778.1 adhesin [Acinetobacter seifertii]
MNKVYKVIWNASIGAWVATSEIAKGKTKTKSKTLNVSAVVLTGVISFAPNAFAGTNTDGGVGQGTSISGTTSCREGNASTANEKDVAIGCGAQTQDRTGSNIANRNNPYNNSTGAYAGAMKQGGAISVGTGAVVEKGLGTAIGSYATTQGISGVAIGTGALSSGNTALALGRQSAATADFSQAIGNVAAATGKGSLAIGHSATAEGYRSIAIGSPDIENADPVAGQAGAAYQPKMATKATGKDSIAFGGGAVATEENALAIGAFSESKGKKSVAIGTGAKAQKDNAVVIGDQAEATFDGGVAIGKGARSEAENSIAVGKDSKAVQATGESFLTKQSAPTGVLSIGDVGSERRIQNVADGAADSDAATIRQLKAARTHYVSINDNGQQGGNFENDGATGRNAIAVGVNTSAAGREAMAIGAYAQAMGSGAISMGSSSQTIGRGDIAIGRNASTKGAEGTPSGYSNQSIAIGDQTKAIGDQSIAIGADVIAKGNSSVAIGGDDVDKIAQDAELSKTYTEITGGVLKAGSYPTTEANHGSTAVGTQAVGTGAFSSAFGMTSKATGDASSAFGVMSNASGKGAAAFGAVAQATGDGASAMGINSLASGTNSTAIGSGNKPGEGAKATGNSAAAIGSGAQATGDNSAAIGKGAEATNENAAAVGGGAKATGKNAAAIGGGAIADQENAVAVGQGAQSLVEGGVALGARSKVEAQNSVALGQDAVATEAAGSSFLTNRDASKSNGVISVGSAGKERRITNVEDGSADSDAVTVRQLKNVDGRVNQNTSNISKNAQNITNLNQKLDDTKTDLGNQITDTNTKLNNTKDQLTTQINDTKTELNNTIGNTKTELNTKIDNTKTELENKGLNFAGNSGADVHRKLGDKLNIVGGAAASTPASKTSGENVITRTTQDGIQIELLKDSKFDSVTTGNTTLNNNGLTIKDGPSITKEGINAGGKQITNVADGVNAKDAVNVDQLTKVKESLNGKITDTNNQLNDAKKDLGNQIVDTNKNLNDAKNDLSNQITDTNTKLNNTKDQLTTQINDTKTELNNTIGNTKTELNSKIDNTKTELENKGLNFAGNSGADVHRKLGEKLNIVGGAAASTPAAKTSGENVITRTTQDGIQIELLKDSKFDSVTTGNTTLNNNGLTIKEGPSITKEGINAGGKQITNVADGVNAKDAVNVDQLTKVKDKLNGKITDTNNQLNDAKKDLGNQIADTNKNLNDAKKDLGNQISDTNTKLNNTKDQLTTQINDTKTELNNTIGNTKTELNTKIDNTKTELENKGLNFAGNSGADVHRKLGERLNIVGGVAASTPALKTSGENVITRTTQDGIQIELLKDSKFDSVTTGNTTLNNNGLTIKDGPSITKEGINAGGKQITNVADGVNVKDAVNKGQLDDLAAKQNATDDAAVKYDDAKTKDKVTLKGKDGTVLDNVKAGNISSTSKEAVNGSQIHNISNSIKNSIGGNTVVNPDGSLTTNNIGGTGKNNINDAISEVKNTATKAKTTVTEGDNVVVKETVNKDGSTNYEVSTKKDLTLNSVTAGDSVLTNNGLTIKEGPSITKDGINAGGKQITNVAEGVNAKDAVNVDQLTKIKDSLNGKITDTNTKLDTTKDQLTTQINDTKTELNNTIGNTKTELNTKIDNTKTELENKGLNFAGNSGADVHRKLGERLNIVGGVAASTPALKTSGENVITRTTQDGIQIELLKDSKFDSVTTGNTTLNNNGLTIKDGPSITKEGINAGGKQITNVADGVNVKDAVNKGQLDDLAAKQNATDDAAVKYDDAKTKDKVTLKGKDGTVLDNVKAGNISSISKEAVNGSQVHNISNSIKNSIGGNTVVNPDGSLTTNNIGGTGKNNINDAISEVKNTATKAKTTVTEGDNIVVKETVNKDGSTNYEVSTKKDLTLDSVTAGDSVLNHNGLTIKDGPSMTKDGINAGGKQITNVADAVNAKDAVNKGQLDDLATKQNATDDVAVKYDDAKTKDKVTLKGKDGTVLDNVKAGNISSTSKEAVNGSQIHNISNSIKNSIGGNTVVNPDGSLTTNNIGGTGKNNINDAISEVKNTATKAKTTVTEGDNIVVKETVNKDGSINYEVSTKKDLTLDSVTAGDSVLTNNGLTIKEGPSITKEGINAGGKQITNVADGVNTKDAVNKGQLDDLAAKQNATDDAAVKYDDAKIKDKVTLKGKDGTILDNVKAGNISSTSKEAVNGSQIHNISNSIKNSIGGNTVVNPDGSLTMNNIGGTGKNNINDAISEVKSTATKAKTTVTEGDNIVVKETVNKDGSTNYEVSTKKDLTLDSVTAGDSVLNHNGLTIKDGPSMTKDGINAGGKKITDVANGVIAQNSKDAVNGGQVHNISTSIKNSIGGNTVVNPDGSLTTNNIGGTGKNNINDAIKSVDDKVTNGVNDLTQKGLNFGANDQKGTQGKAVHRKLGDTINIVGGANPETAEDKTSGENIITRTTEDGIKIEMLKDVKFDSVNVGGHVLNQQGLIIKGGPSITINGIDAGSKQITNVADGVNAKDAVNKGQLDKQINEVKDQIGKDIGKLSDHAVQYDKDKNGNVDKNSVTLGGGDKGTNLKNVADGKVAEGSKDAVNGGQLWNVQNQVDKNSNDIKNIQNNIDNISNGKAGLVQQQKPNDEITVGKDTGGTSVNMTGKDGDRVVQGVKDGEIKAGSNQAVNGGQIHNVSDSIKNSIGGNTSVNSDGSITTKNIGGTGKDNINDAIGTLNQSNQELGNKITNLGDQLQQVFYDTNKRIDDVEKKANAGIAAAMALENAPFVAGKYTYAVGAAYHGGENAVGVTLRKTSDNGRWSITGGVAAASQGEPSVRIGISGVIN